MLACNSIQLSIYLIDLDNLKLSAYNTAKTERFTVDRSLIKIANKN